MEKGVTTKGKINFTSVFVQVSITVAGILLANLLWDMWKQKKS